MSNPGSESSDAYGQIIVPHGATVGDGLHVEFELQGKAAKKKQTPADVRRLIIRIPEESQPGHVLNVTKEIVLVENIGPSRLDEQKITRYAEHYVEENSMSMIDMLLCFLDLAENIFTVFAFSSAYSFGTVLTTFLVLDLIKAEARAFSTCCLRTTAVPLIILLTCCEVVQAIAYMYFCDFTAVSIAFCAGLAGLEIIFTAISEVSGRLDYVNFREKMDILQAQLSEEEAQKASMNEFCNHCLTKPLAVGVIAVVSGVSFSYTASDSPFQSLWFQVLLTFYVWFLASGYEWMLDMYYKVIVSEEEVHREAIGLVVVTKKLPYGVVAFIAYGLVLFAISIDYYKVAELEYDYVLCIFSLIGGSFIFCFACLGCCMLISTYQPTAKSGGNVGGRGETYVNDVADLTPGNQEVRV
jgi:hypothetical protein